MTEVISDQNDEPADRSGNDAEQLLQNETFNRTINGPVEASRQAFAASAPEDTKGEKKTHAHYALVDIVHTLQQRVSVRDEILANNDNSGDE